MPEYNWMQDKVSDLAHVNAHRRALRATALMRREGLTPEMHLALTGRIEAHLDRLLATLSPRILGFCWPHRAEPDLRGWAEGWRQCAATLRHLALPVVQVESHTLIFRTWSQGEPLEIDHHGIPFPVRGEEVVPDVVLVPLNAFDAAGFRLGYGGGYFDRTLARLQMVAVGVGFELGRVASVFPLAHDRPMDWLVTEAGVFHPLG